MWIGCGQPWRARRLARHERAPGRPLAIAARSRSRSPCHRALAGPLAEPADRLSYSGDPIEQVLEQPVIVDVPGADVHEGGHPRPNNTALAGPPGRSPV